MRLTVLFPPLSLYNRPLRFQGNIIFQDLKGSAADFPSFLHSFVLELDVLEGCFKKGRDLLQRRKERSFRGGLAETQTRIYN